MKRFPPLLFAVASLGLLVFSPGFSRADYVPDPPPVKSATPAPAPAPATQPQREYWPGFGWVEKRGGYWWIMETQPAPTVAAPSPTGPAPKAVAGGCGCEPGANCGASFCKSRGGTGCPASCPVKKRVGAAEQEKTPTPPTAVEAAPLPLLRIGTTATRGAGSC